jgi:hypothetical protein
MNPQRVVHFALRVMAVSLFAVYVAWNVWFLSRGRIPRSLMKGIFGLPAPTTGGTRSVECLLAGDLPGSLLWNAMTLPILALLLVSVAILFLRLVRRRPLRFPRWMSFAWLIVLTVAWVLKLAGSSAYW